MKIAIGSDHAGFKYKELIKAYLQKKGITVQDFGTVSDASCDYPDFIIPVAKAVRDGKANRGIVLGGSGNGEAIAANRIAKVRCTIAWNIDSAELGRKHNDSNVLSLGQRMIQERDLFDIVEVWLTTEFEGGRHIPRIEKIETLSKS
jgi:ribose 5-phosphate isomerase B